MSIRATVMKMSVAGLLSVGAFSSCNTDRSPCLEPMVAQVQLAFYKLDTATNTYVDSLLPNANLVSLDIDSAKFWNIGLKGRSKFSILLSPLHDTTRWALQPDSAVSPVDTLMFVYERKLQFVSNACGYTYFYNIKSVATTRHNIDSLFINSSDVNTDAGSDHVKIFF